jgi:hypothetical protein
MVSHRRALRSRSWTGASVRRALLACAVLPGLLGLRSPVNRGRAPRQFALMIGIADYKNFTLKGAPGESDLEGPMNDIAIFSSLLRAWGFSDPTAIRVLRDAAASKAGILAAFDWIVSQATEPDDIVVIFYSGHGTRVVDIDGDEAKRTPGDTLDEALVPWDAPVGTITRTSAPRYLIDDEIRSALVDRLRTKNVTIVLDACYSGTATRGAADDRVARAKGPLGGGAATDSADAALDPEDGARYTLITAASAYETARETRFPTGTGTQVVGALTWAMHRALSNAPRSARWTDIYPNVVRIVRESGISQTPQLEGRLDGRLFDVNRAALPSKDFSRVIAVRATKFMLDQGALQGFRIGSVLDVYAESDSTLSGTPLAQIQIDSLNDTLSFGRRISTEGAISIGQRASLAKLPLGIRMSTRTPVWVSRDVVAAREMVAADTSFTLVADSAAAHLHVVRDDSLKQPVVIARGVRVIPVAAGPNPPFEPHQLRRALGAKVLGELDVAAPNTGGFDVRSVIKQGGASEPPDASADAFFANQTPHEPLHAGRRYTMWVKVNAPAGTTLYASAITAGYTGDLTQFPSDRFDPMPIPLRTWVPLQTFKPTPPFGPEVIHLLVSTTPFSFAPFAEAMKGPRSGAPARGLESVTEVVAGWRHQVLRVVLVPEQL